MALGGKEMRIKQLIIMGWILSRRKCELLRG